jgi:AraC-like DNA-binding protein
MPKLIANVAIPKIKIERNRTVQVHTYSPRAIAFAQPLFEDEVEVFGYYERVSRVTHRRSQAGRWHQLYFMLQGSLTYECGDREVVASRGQIMLLPAEHSYRRVKMSKTHRYLNFRIKSTPTWSSLTEAGPYVRVYQDIDLIYTMVVKVLNRIRQDSLDLREECLQYSRMILSLLKIELFHNNKSHSEEARFAELARKIKQEPEMKWTVKKMADSLSISTSTVGRLFQKYYQISAINFVIKLRMERSIEMLLSNEYSIAIIAKNVGYSNASVFSDLFLRHTGVRPGAFRKNHR